jgi:hypothetical protein
MAKSSNIQTKDKSTKVSDLSVEELKDLIKQTVQETIDDMLGDPDEGLELREEFVAQLKKSLESDEKMIPLEEVVKKIGLK